MPLLPETRSSNSKGLVAPFQLKDTACFSTKTICLGPIGLESFGESIIACGWVGTRPLATWQTFLVTSQITQIRAVQMDQISGFLIHVATVKGVEAAFS